MRARVITVVMVVIVVMAIPLCFTGCGGGFGEGAAAGTGLGAMLQGTITGAKQDLKAREEALIKVYNEGVTIGAEQQELDAIAKELEWVRRGQTGLDTGEKFLDLDWSNPKEAGLAVGGVIQLALLILGGRKLTQTTKELKGTQAGINKFCGTHNATVAGELHDIVKVKVGVT